MPAICRSLLVGCLAFAWAAAALPAAHGKPRPQQLAEEAARKRPMAFFIAKGRANACGEGCSEWIAAEGVFDGGSAKRFKAFLAEIERDNLPVFFNSLGGSVSQSILIGTMLRERRMTVAVGRTRPNECGRSMREEACHSVMQSKTEHAARLSVEGARCFSACTYAFLGGSTRNVGRGARIGVHSAFPRSDVTDPEKGRALVDNVHALLRRYSVVMGVDAGLIDLAAGIRPERMHRLSADELARFGVETAAFYETRWLPIRESSQRFVLLKAVTHRTAATSTEHLTNMIKIGCTATGGVTSRATYVALRRELPLNAAKVPTALRATFGDHAVPIVRRQTKNAVETGVASARAAVFEQASAARDIVVTETEVANGAQEERRELKLSTAGLPEALAEFRKHCNETTTTRPGVPGALAGAAARK